MGHRAFNRYYVCRNGEVEQFRCARGIYWNQNVQECDLPENVNCKQRNEYF